MPDVRLYLVYALILMINCFYHPSVTSSDDSLMQPQVSDAIKPFHDGSELWKNYRYTRSESRSYNRSVARKMIVRNHDYLMGNYRLLALYMRAGLLDLMSNGYLLNRIEDFRHQFPAGLQRWASHALIDTRVSSQFAGRSEGDPWGSVKGAPTRKELLPSEMWGLSVYTGRITGKPLSLVNFLLSVVRIYGASAHNVFMLEDGSRPIGLFYTYPGLYLIESTSIYRLDRGDEPRLQSTFFGFANDRYYYSGIFDLNSTEYSIDLSLLDQIKQESGIRPFKLDSPYVVDYITHRDLPLRFGTIENPELAYALHSLMVPDRGLYMEVSADGPLVQSLSQRMDSTSQILDWMKTNLRLGSIYYNYKERFMIADQVLVYRFGTRKDQALLLASYLLNKGINPSILITADDAYVRAGSSIYRLSTYSNTESVGDSVILEISL